MAFATADERALFSVADKNKSEQSELCSGVGCVDKKDTHVIKDKNALTIYDFL